jgi:hypothetical protein
LANNAYFQPMNQQVSMSERWKIGLVLLSAAFLVFLTLNRHSKAEPFTYHSELWADKAGYYIYLPAFFIYNFDADQLPDSIAERTGHGFSLNERVIQTKYSYGVAALQTPFFLLAHGIAHFTDQESDGFSPVYHKFINLSAVCYGLLGLILLVGFLKQYVSQQSALWTVVLLFLGTHLSYYTLFDTGMSHVYSFFLFAAFLRLTRYFSYTPAKWTHVVILGLVVGLLIAVRPMNLLVLPAFLLFSERTFSDWFVHLKELVVSILIAFAVFVPQMMYWHYSSGSYFHYAYGNEGFPNLFAPQVINLWFSTHNGLFPFVPFAGILVLSMFIGWKKEWRNKWIFAYFLVVSYLFSAWHDVTYGCSFGSRPFVEYLALFAFPFALFIDRLKHNRPAKMTLIVLSLICAAYTQKLAFSYDGCWYGGDFDWSGLWNLLTGPTK